MAAELLLIGNPARRKRKAAPRKNRATRRKASPAQMRARAKFAAMSRSRARARKASRTSSTTVRSNPVKRRVHHVAKRRHVARRRHHAVRRNPASRTSVHATSMAVTSHLKEAAMGAAGAIGVDAVFGFVSPYLPATVSSPTDATGTNYMYYAAKGATAFGVAMLLRKAVGAAKAAKVLNGSLTVTMHDMLKGLMGSALPSVTLGKYTGAQQTLHQNLRGMPGGRALPPLPASQSLRMYAGGAASREALLR